MAGKPARGAAGRDAAACETVKAIVPDASEEEVLQALKNALGDPDQAVIELTGQLEWKDVGKKKKKGGGSRTGEKLFDRNDRNDRSSRDFPFRENDRRGGGERSGRGGPRGRGGDRGGDMEGAPGRGRGGRGRGRGRGSAPDVGTGRGRSSPGYSSGPTPDITYSTVPDENQGDNISYADRSPSRPVTSAVISDPSVSWASKVKASQAPARTTPEPEASPIQEEHPDTSFGDAGQDAWGQAAPVEQPAEQHVQDDETFVPHQQFAPQQDEGAWGRQANWSTPADAGVADAGAAEPFSSPPGLPQQQAPGAYSSDAQAFSLEDLSRDLPNTSYQSDKPAPYYGKPKDPSQAPPPAAYAGENELHTLFPPQPETKQPPPFAQAFPHPQYAPEAPPYSAEAPPPPPPQPAQLSPRPPSGTTDSTAPVQPPPPDGSDGAPHGAVRPSFDNGYGSIDSGAQGTGQYMHAAPNDGDMPPEASAAPAPQQAPQAGQNGMPNGGAAGGKHMEGMQTDSSQMGMQQQPFGGMPSDLQSQQQWGMQPGALQNDMFMQRGGSQGQMMGQGMHGMMPGMPAQIPAQGQMPQPYGMQFQGYPQSGPNYANAAPMYHPNQFQGYAMPQGAYGASYHPSFYAQAQFPGGMPGGSQFTPQNGASFAGKQGSEYGRGNGGGGSAAGGGGGGGGRGRAGPSGRGPKSGSKGTRGTAASAGNYGAAPNGTFGGPSNAGLDANQYQPQQHATAMFAHGGAYSEWGAASQQNFPKDNKGGAYAYQGSGAAAYGGDFGNYYAPQQQQQQQQQHVPQFAAQGFSAQQQPGGWPNDAKAFSGKGGGQY